MRPTARLPALCLQPRSGPRPRPSGSRGSRAPRARPRVRWCSPRRSLAPPLARRRLLTLSARWWRFGGSPLTVASPIAPWDGGRSGLSSMARIPRHHHRTPMPPTTRQRPMARLRSGLRHYSKRAVSPGRGDLITLTLNERGRTIKAWCPDDEVFTLTRELVLDRIYESDVIALRPGLGTVLDAGAHVGIFSLQASQWAKRVVALEANRINFDLLSLNVDRNALDNVEPRHLALWKTTSEAMPFSTAHHSGGGRVDEESGDEGTGAVRYVRTVSLDDLVSETELLPAPRSARLWRNRNALNGKRLVKILAAAYYLAPIEKPIRSPGATYELPILFAHR